MSEYYLFFACVEEHDIVGITPSHTFFWLQ